MFLQIGHAPCCNILQDVAEIEEPKCFRHNQCNYFFFHFRSLVTLADVFPAPQGSQVATEHREIQEFPEIMAYPDQSAKLV